MQETWGQAFKRRPLEIILLFTIGLPLLPFMLIFGYGFTLFKTGSDKKKYNEIVESLSKIEAELRSSGKSKSEYLQRCFDQAGIHLISNSYVRNEARDELREAMVKQTWSDLEQLGCDPAMKYRIVLDVEQSTLELVEKGVDRIFLSAENEIDAMLKRISLAENITQSHNSEYGAFFNAYQDLVDVFDNCYSDFSEPVKKAYGYARIELSAILLLQGILSDANFNEEKCLFPDNKIDWENLDSSAKFEALAKADEAAFDGLSKVDDSEFEKSEALDLADAFISKYGSSSGHNDCYYFSDSQFALWLVYSGKITSSMVGSINRSEQEVRQLISRLWELDRDKDNVSIESLSNSKNIYKSLLGYGDYKNFNGGPQDDDNTKQEP